MNVDELVNEVSGKYIRAILADVRHGNEMAGHTLVKMAIREAILETRKAQWIPVSERLPKEEDWVLVYAPDADGKLDPKCAVASRYDGVWMGELDDYKEEAVTHWMPLPSSPAASKPQDAGKDEL